MSVQVAVGAALASALLLAVAGCGGSGSKPHSSPTTTSTRPTLASPTVVPPGEVAAVRSAFTRFFAGSTPAADKIALVQDGPEFARTIKAQAASGLAKSASVKVSRVTPQSATQASVVYTVSLGGVAALKNQKGQAVKESGRWKVAASTFCTLLDLEGNAPAVCKTVS